LSIAAFKVEGSYAANASNESTDGGANMTNDRIVGERRREDTRHERAPNEPPIDPLPVGHGTLEGVQQSVHPVADEPALESYEDGIKRIRRSREERVRRWNEKAREDAADAMAARRARRREQKCEPREPGSPRKRREASTGQNSTDQSPGLEMSELNKLQCATFAC
jgi:hypothetical protein